MEFTSKSFIFKKEKKSCSSRIDNIKSIINISDLYLDKTEIEIINNWIIISNDIEILKK